MIVEHEVVTTLPATEAMERVRHAARAMGFTVEEASETRLRARRGEQRAVRARSARELPQALRVDFDRGRLSLAIVAHERRRKPERLEREMLLEIARVIERGVTEGTADPPLLDAWAPLDADLARIARFSRRSRRALLWTLVALIVIIFLLASLAPT